ncbi:MAG TPA: hypothetical protein VHL79_18985, partial [Ramlibacter sp.]|nr:hypothetical protein [Ramlibacter sp.]
MHARPEEELLIATEALRLRSVLVAAAVLIGILWLHLLSAVFSGLAGYVLYRRVRSFTGPTDRSWQTRAVRWLIVAAVVAGIGAAVLGGIELLFKAGGLARLMQLTADTLDQLRATAPQWVVERLPESAEAVREAVTRWLRSHSGDMQRWGAEALKVLLHIIIGLAIGLMAAAARPPMEPV